MNEMKDLLDELIDAAIGSIFENTRLIDGVTTYSWKINSKLIENGFSDSEAFELTKILLAHSYLNSKK